MGIADILKKAKEKTKEIVDEVKSHASNVSDSVEEMYKGAKDAYDDSGAPEALESVVDKSKPYISRASDIAGGILSSETFDFANAKKFKTPQYAKFQHMVEGTMLDVLDESNSLVRKNYSTAIAKAAYGLVEGKTKLKQVISLHKSRVKYDTEKAFVGGIVLGLKTAQKENISIDSYISKGKTVPKQSYEASDFVTQIALYNKA